MTPSTVSIKNLQDAGYPSIEIKKIMKALKEPTFFPKDFYGDAFKRTLKACRGYLWRGTRFHSKKCETMAYADANLERNSKYGRSNMCRNCRLEYRSISYEDMRKSGEAEGLARLKKYFQPLKVCPGYLWNGKRIHAKDCTKEAWIEENLKLFTKTAHLCVVCAREYSSKSYKSLRLQALERMCDGEPYCQWPEGNWNGNGPCKDLRALCIDHIHGNAKKDRKKYGSCTAAFYKYLLGLPLHELRSNYQVLCHNHNVIKSYENNERSGS